MRILVVENSRHVPPGLVGDVLVERGAELVTVRPVEGEALPPGPEGFDGALVLGGPQSANDDEGHPYIPDLLGLIRAFGAAERPLMGICLGAQMLARAYGARVRVHDVPEIGFVPLDATADAGNDPLLADSIPLPAILEWHFDSFALPEGAVLLAGGTDCANQIFRLGEDLYGFQCHFEADAAIARAWAQRFTLPAGGARPAAIPEDVPGHIEAQLVRHGDQAVAFGRGVAGRWAERVEHRAAERARRNAAE